MSAPRFFVDVPLSAGEVIDLPEPVAHHALRVLRLADGAPILLFDGRGGQYPSELIVDGRNARARVQRFDPVERESPLVLTLAQAWIATDKLDWVVEKAVELGAAAIVLFPAERSVVRLTGERRERRVSHLRQIAVAACAQCGRNRVPALTAAESLRDAVSRLPERGRFVMSPEAGAAHTLQRIDAAGIIVGPEGGFTDGEIALATAEGCMPIRLGPRVLRTETAGLAALAAMQAWAGDFR
jgi:16S rRNA (uracil1498-N3)-methyltransferase